jgi:hypothetical protein
MPDSPEAIVAAIARRDFASVQAMLDPEVVFRFATPNKALEIKGAAATVEQLKAWFAHGEVEATGHGVAPGPGNTVRGWYSFRVRPQPVTQAPGWHRIEQQVYLTVGKDPVRNIRMACSGYIAEEPGPR